MLLFSEEFDRLAVETFKELTVKDFLELNFLISYKLIEQ